MEVKTNQMSPTCVELPVQPGVKHIIGAQLRNLRDFICHKHPQSPGSSVNGHPEKKGMLRKSAGLHLQVYKMTDEHGYPCSIFFFTVKDYKQHKWPSTGD